MSMGMIMSMSMMNGGCGIDVDDLWPAFTRRIAHGSPCGTFGRVSIRPCTPKVLNLLILNFLII